MIVVVIIGILAAVVMPSMANFMDKQRVVDAAEAIYGQVAYARSEAIARSRMVYVRVVVTDPPSSTWAIGVSTTQNCNPALTDPSATGACVLSVSGQNVLKRIVSTDYQDVVLATNTTQINFDPVRGTAGNPGTMTISYKNRDLFVKVSTIGRTRVCTDPTNNRVGGYSEC